MTPPFSRVTLPHCVAKLSWQKWEPAFWQDVWIYRRHFQVPANYRRHRVFLDFTRVMTKATSVPQRPCAAANIWAAICLFPAKLRICLKAATTSLAVAVDSRWQSIPPGWQAQGRIQR